MTISALGDTVRYSDGSTSAKTAQMSVTLSAATEYETVAASQTDQVIGATGATGDYLERIIIQVSTAATAAVTVKDNATTIFTFANSPGGGIGTYVIPLGIRSVSGAWKITTGAGSAVLAIGDFT